jgi:hypothetical protein
LEQARLAANSSQRVTASFKHLDTSDTWWQRYFGDTAQSRQRAYFAGGV